MRPYSCLGSKPGSPRLMVYHLHHDQHKYTRTMPASMQGTQSTRFFLYDKQCRPLASSQVEFPQIYPHAGWVMPEASGAGMPVLYCFFAAPGRQLWIAPLGRAPCRRWVEQDPLAIWRSVQEAVQQTMTAALEQYGALTVTAIGITNQRERANTVAEAMPGHPGLSGAAAPLD